MVVASTEHSGIVLEADALSQDDQQDSDAFLTVCRWVTNWTVWMDGIPSTPRGYSRGIVGGVVQQAGQVKTIHPFCVLHQPQSNYQATLDTDTTLFLSKTTPTKDDHDTPVALSPPSLAQQQQPTPTAALSPLFIADDAMHTQQLHTCTSCSRPATSAPSLPLQPSQLLPNVSITIHHPAADNPHRPHRSDAGRCATRHATICQDPGTEDPLRLFGWCL
nr:hypothetical protein L204_04262 [Cryptococcus depauperatus CBS 7855]